VTAGRIIAIKNEIKHDLATSLEHEADRQPDHPAASVMKRVAEKFRDED
jgi:hypothetical protein